MLKLRTILLYNYPYYIALIVSLIVSLIRLNIPRESIYTEKSNKCEGVVINYKISDNVVNMTIKNSENILVNYYIKEENDRDIFNDISLGDVVKIEGEFIKPSENSTKNLFDYRKYLYNKNTFFIVNAVSYSKISSSINPYYKIKQFILDRTSDSPYLKAFILGDKSLISKKALTSYQENGISHLLAISGMHITLLSSLIDKLLRKLKVREKKRFISISIFLIFYLFLTGLSSSTFRGVLFYMLFTLNKLYYFYIKSINIFMVILAITLFVNPYFIYDVGFQYSFLISFSLLTFSKFITGNYLVKLLKTSFISFVVSIPISLFNYYQINLLSIIYNLFYVPLVSFIIFPLSLLTIIFKSLLPIYNLLTYIMEVSSIYLDKITLFKLIFPKVSLVIYFIYLILSLYSIWCLIKNRKWPIYILFLILIFHYTSPLLKNDNYLMMIDVGQGDSILVRSKNDSILIDTGGKLSFSNNDSSKIVTNTTIPLLKSLGIRKLKYLILTHGDADHMGEAKYLIEKFKVENIIINSGSINHLEKELIKIRKDVVKGYEGLQIICGNFEFIQLNEEYSDENTGSQIYYATDGNINILLTGDASIESELNLINKYDLPEIDILKVGHHGSKTSSSEKFINTINPKYSLISCGKDNKFGHPNKEILNVLENSKIYRTDQDGSIMFKIKNNKLKIETCSP